MSFSKTDFTTGLEENVDLSSNHTSEWYEVGIRPLVLIQVYALNANSTIGTITVEGTNFPKDGNTGAVQVLFYDNSGSEVTSVAVTSGIDVNEGMQIWPAGFAAYRWKFTNTSGGSGDTAKARIVTKRFH